MTSGRVGSATHERDQLRLVSALLPIAKNFRTIMDAELRSIGLEVGQDQLLLAITEDDASVVSKLAAQLNVRPSTLSKMTDKMAAKGMVVRSKVPSDGRRTGLRLTEMGLQMQSEVRRIHEALGAELTKALDPDGRGKTLAGLIIIAPVISKRLARRR